MSKSALFAALLCSYLSFANAEEIYNLNEVVVTATRIEQPLKQALASTTVITQKDIQESQAVDLPTILRNVPGVELSLNGGHGKASAVYLRGSESTHTLILLDGVRINSATTDTTAIQDLMLDQVERIEIVRGNVSSLYGSEAIGGVIQIFTKKAHGANSQNVSIGVGNLGTQRISAGIGSSADNTEYHLQVSSFNTTGVSAINPALNAKVNADTDGYRNTSVSANVRHILNQDHSLTLNVFNSMGENQYDNSNGPSNVANTNTQKLSKLSMASDDTLSDNWKSHLQLAQGVDEYHDLADGVPVYYSGSPSSLFKTVNQQLTWQNSIAAGNGKQFLLGLENLSQIVDTDTKYAITQRTINSIYAGYTGNYDAHQIQANLRQDNNSQFGAANTGLLGYGYKLNESWRATTSYSTAFRAPTFNDLYYPGYGNVNLKPENSQNFEAGLHFTSASQNLDVAYFNNLTQNLIVWQSVSPYTPVNINQARNDGVELSHRISFEDTSIKTAITSQNPRNDATGVQLDRRAKLFGSLGISHKIGKMLMGGEWQHSDERLDNSHTLASYDVFNLTASYVLNKETTLAVRAENITDQNNSPAYSYNPLGPTLYASLSYQQ